MNRDKMNTDKMNTDKNTDKINTNKMNSDKMNTNKMNSDKMNTDFSLKLYEKIVENGKRFIFNIDFTLLSQLFATKLQHEFEHSPLFMGKISMTDFQISNTLKFVHEDFDSLKLVDKDLYILIIQDFINYIHSNPLFKGIFILDCKVKVKKLLSKNKVIGNYEDYIFKVKIDNPHLY
jgi:hypothetical protein